MLRTPIVALHLAALGARGAPLRAPPVIASHSGVLETTLRVEVARFEIAELNVSFWTRAYDGHPVGPTLLVAPGDDAFVTLDNRLGAGGGGGLAEGSRANASNLHVHGIYDSPTHDNTFVDVEPGASRTWHYAVDERAGSSLLWCARGAPHISICDLPLERQNRYEVCHDVRDCPKGSGAESLPLSHTLVAHPSAEG